MFKRLLVIVAVVTGLTGVLVPAGPASAAVGGRPIAPGVRMVTAGTPCTAGPVLRDARGRTLVAYAARCAAARPVGTKVRFTSDRGRTLARGRLAWVGAGLALVRVDPRRTSARMPQWGGPAGLAALPGVGEPVFTLGRTGGGLAPRTELLSSGDRLTPALAFAGSDSGAPVLDSHGRAVGLVSVASGVVQVVGLDDAIAAARSHGVRGLAVVRGGAFAPSAVA